MQIMQYFHYIMHEKLKTDNYPCVCTLSDQKYLDTYSKL
jgi:hypothetical protein